MDSQPPKIPSALSHCVTECISRCLQTAQPNAEPHAPRHPDSRQAATGNLTSCAMYFLVPAVAFTHILSDQKPISPLKMSNHLRKRCSKITHCFSESYVVHNSFQQGFFFLFFQHIDSSACHVKWNHQQRSNISKLVFSVSRA